MWRVCAWIIEPLFLAMKAFILELNKCTVLYKPVNMGLELVVTLKNYSVFDIILWLEKFCNGANNNCVESKWLHGEFKHKQNHKNHPK